jgi:predicted DNA binding CopG/RHH family protein
MKLRMPEGMLKAVKLRAKQRNIPYWGLIHDEIEDALRGKWARE